MNWFTRLCRQAGLAVHHIAHPTPVRKQQIKRTTQEKKLDEYTTLRRTTIDEIEIRQKPSTDDDRRDETSS